MVLIPTPPSSLTPPPPPNCRRVDILYYKRLTKGTLSVINGQLSWIQNSQKKSVQRTVTEVTSTIITRHTPAEMMKKVMNLYDSMVYYSFTWTKVNATKIKGNTCTLPQAKKDTKSKVNFDFSLDLIS